MLFDIRITIIKASSNVTIQFKNRYTNQTRFQQSLSWTNRWWIIIWFYEFFTLWMIHSLTLGMKITIMVTPILEKKITQTIAVCCAKSFMNNFLEIFSIYNCCYWNDTTNVFFHRWMNTLKMLIVFVILVMKYQLWNDSFSFFLPLYFC